MLLVDCTQVLLQLGCQEKGKELPLTEKAYGGTMKGEVIEKNPFCYLHALDSAPFLPAAGRCLLAVAAQRSRRHMRPPSAPQPLRSGLPPGRRGGWLGGWRGDARRCAPGTAPPRYRRPSAAGPEPPAPSGCGSAPAGTAPPRRSARLTAHGLREIEHREPPGRTGAYPYSQPCPSLSQPAVAERLQLRTSAPVCPATALIRRRSTMKASGPVALTLPGTTAGLAMAPAPRGVPAPHRAPRHPSAALPPPQARRAGAVPGHAGSRSPPGRGTPVVAVAAPGSPPRTRVRASRCW
ncbi:nascent polypeptide-associated complex subunit alpha, muscle-specific form-like [Falco naumanni]|uniref:nascent polypeptide-associated complex subunit alpha, muscle-specific form-like n=1 Tax=Falco naumanni TaxID=148594 RepID=UPI001ADE2115|nr:nascent polypeptide-associated complex subunit alpha, muscle-specific form-like [Falco naumanni]